MPKNAYKRLPKSNNGTPRTHSSFGLYEYQKDELRRRAHGRGEGISYYVNSLLWADWLNAQETPRPRRRREDRDRNRRDK